MRGFRFDKPVTHKWKEGIRYGVAGTIIRVGKSFTTLWLPLELDSSVTEMDGKLCPAGTRSSVIIDTYVQIKWQILVNYRNSHDRFSSTVHMLSWDTARVSPLSNYDRESSNLHKWIQVNFWNTRGKKGKLNKKVNLLLFSLLVESMFFWKAVHLLCYSFHAHSMTGYSICHFQWSPPARNHNWLSINVALQCFYKEHTSLIIFQLEITKAKCFHSKCLLCCFFFFICLSIRDLVCG